MRISFLKIGPNIHALHLDKLASKFSVTSTIQTIQLYLKKKQRSFARYVKMVLFLYYKAYDSSIKHEQICQR